MSKRIFYISLDQKDKDNMNDYDNIVVWPCRPVLDERGVWEANKVDDDFVIKEIGIEGFKSIFKKSCRYGTCQKVELTILDEFKE